MDFDSIPADYLQTIHTKIQVCRETYRITTIKYYMVITIISASAFLFEETLFIKNFIY